MMRWIPPKQWSRIHVVHCGLGPEYLDSLVPPVEAGAGFLAVGRLSEEKGHMCLVNAFARLPKTGASSRLVLAGDGPLRAVIEGRCRELGIADRVKITGWVSGDQVRQLLLESRALVLPSFAEGLPVVLMESLAMGRPVVSSWVAGVPELVEAGINGWLVPPGNEEALAQALQQCLDASLETLARMGSAGQDAVQQRHDARIEGARLAGLFRNVGSVQPSLG
jgi:glycosyltransferase involved in cell wall biosynthesis